MTWPTKPPRSGAEKRFRSWVAEQLNRNPKHPLNRIVRDLETDAIRSTSAASAGADAPGYDAGHLTSRGYEKPNQEFFAVEDPWHNRRVEGSDERKGVIFEREAIDIDGIPVDKKT